MEDALVLSGRDARFIPGNRAPLVAHPLTAGSLMCITSGVLLVNKVAESSKFELFELFLAFQTSSGMTRKQSEYKNMTASPGYNCRPFVRLDVSD